MSEVAATKNYLSTGEVAEILGVSPVSVWRWAMSGRIKAIRTPSGRFRIPKAEVEKLVKNKS